MTSTTPRLPASRTPWRHDPHAIVAVGSPGPARDEIRSAFAALGARLAATGAGPADVRMMVCLLSDWTAAEALADEYAAFFGDAGPARRMTAVGTSEVGRHVELRATLD